MPRVAQPIADLAASPRVRTALDWFSRERAWINEQHLKVCRIPSPTFFEQKRAEWISDQLRALGWEAKLDRAGNVVANLANHRDTPVVAVTAHLDTVLAPRSPEDIRVASDGRFHGPGVADNGAGLAGLLAIAAAWSDVPPLDEFAVAPLLVANVGEEGEGNLSGMRYFCRGSNLTKIRAFLILDGPNVEHITSRALASRRFDVVFSGPGGHSWRDSGVGNPVHSLSRAITLFNDRAQVLVSEQPRTTFNFGILDGGVSINSIPSEARAKVDLRSQEPERIDALATLLGSVVEEAVEIENSSKAAGRITGKIKEIGSRPGGDLPPDAPILECIRAVDAHLGIRSRLDCSSTDANIPLSLGLPAISIGAGGSGGGAHTASEWFLPDGRELGLRRIMLALCMLITAESLHHSNRSKSNILNSLDL